MISIVITSFNEPKTIGRAIESFLNQNIKEKYELVVSAPDKETQDIARRYKKVKLFKDPGKGKSFALNLILKKIKGEIILLSDGDVYVSNNSVNEILTKFKDKDVGCVTGRPIPMEDKKTKYGYWANFLFDSAHRLRKKLREKKGFLECSGYLWGFRTGIVNNFPLDVAEDTIIPFFFFEKGYKIDYAENALVFIKNVNNWKDWISQKVRTSRAHETLDKYVNTKKIPRTKNFINESKGLFLFFSYPKTIKEFFWMFELILARLYMWAVVFMEVHLRKKYHKDKWSRVESTK